MNFYNTFVQLCQEKGISPSAAAEAVGINKSNVTAWKKEGYSPRNDALQKIADYFEVSADFLLGKTNVRRDPFIPVNATIPVLGFIRAGHPILAEENIIGYDFADVKNPEEYFYLSVTGDSMTGAGIRHGSRVLVHRQSYAENGQIVVCRINGADATLKRFKQQGDMVLLLPENLEYEPIILPCSDFENGEAEILGVAKEVVSKL